MKEKILSTLKSSETDDWLDIHVVRPLAYYFALFFAKLDIHPNTVTIVSMIIGASSFIFLAHGSFYYEGTHGLYMNIIGLLLLVLADILDCTDGQLARLTGKTSRIGRILDGISGFIWFIPVYAALTWRVFTYHSIEFGWFGITDTYEASLILLVFVLVLGFCSGMVCFAGQSRVADYYIQVHLFFLKGEKGSELDNSAKQQKTYEDTPWKGNFFWKLFLRSYVNYTKKQEKKTPNFQRLLAVLKEKYGSTENIPAAFRQKFHDYSLPVLTYNGLLTFNFRMAFFILFLLLDLPLMYFVFEVVFMSLLCEYIVHRHESFCRKLTEEL